MGFGTKQGRSGSTTFFKINGKTGEMTHWIKDPSQPKGGYAEKVDYVAGVIADLMVVEVDYKNGDDPGHNLQITLRDGDDRYKVEMSATSGFAARFVGVLNAVKESGEVFAISPFLAQAGKPMFKDGPLRDSDSVYVTLRPVIGTEADGSPKFGDSIQPFFGEGQSLPDAPPLTSSSGKPILKNGRQMRDTEARDAFVSQMIVNLCWHYNPERMRAEQARAEQEQGDGQSGEEPAGDAPSAARPRAAA